jgi:hypothetical protein
MGSAGSGLWGIHVGEHVRFSSSAWFAGRGCNCGSCGVGEWLSAGEPFTLWKFRAMVVDAEARRGQLLRLNDGHGCCLRCVTIRGSPGREAGCAAGRWMSFRSCSTCCPAACHWSVAEYGIHMRRRLAVKPGITGLWHVSGRSVLSWDEAERLDVRYVENWSLALDLQILWKTLSAITRGSGAYW